MEKLSIKVVLIISLFLISTQNLMGQEEQLANLEIEEMIQDIIDFKDINKLIKSMTLVKTMNNELRLIFDNGILPNEVNLRFDNTPVSFGINEDFFHSGGDRLIFNYISRNGNQAEVNFTIFVAEEIHEGWTKFNQNGSSWNLEKCILKRKR